MFKIVSEAGIAAGVRRIEALAGRRAYREIKKEEQSLQEIAQALKSSDADIVGRGEKLVAQLKESEKELDRMKHKMQASQAGVMIEGAKMINGVRVLARRVENMDPKDLRDFGDKLRDNIKSGILALGSVKDNKVSLIVMVSKDLVPVSRRQLSSRKWLQSWAAGGGKADLAQSGGKVPKLDAALGRLVRSGKSSRMVPTKEVPLVSCNGFFPFSHRICVMLYRLGQGGHHECSRMLSKSNVGRVGSSGKGQGISRRTGQGRGTFQERGRRARQGVDVQGRGKHQGFGPQGQRRRCGCI
jgi:hypothetical protein